MTSQTPSAEQIQREMQQVRTDMRADVRELVESAREMGIWQRYVQAYPWTCLGAAAFIGYVIVPSRSRVIQPDARQMAELVNAQLDVKSSAKARPGGGLLSTAMSGVVGMAANSLLQVGMGLLNQQVNQYVARTLAAQQREPHSNGEAHDHA